MLKKRLNKTVKKKNKNDTTNKKKQVLKKLIF